mgnify:CR=1 FL=1
MPEPAGELENNFHVIEHAFRQRHWRADVGTGLEAIALRCLEKDPADRYQSAAAMRSEPTMFAGRDAVNPQAGKDCVADLYAQAATFATRLIEDFGVSPPSLREAWMGLCPDPSALIGMPASVPVTASATLSNERDRIRSKAR